MITHAIRVLGPTQGRRVSVSRRDIIAIAALLCQALFIFISQASTAETRAILIGVSQFDHLKITPLEGPKNDVMLMAATLQARGVPHKNVIRLVDSEAQHYQPTRTNILRVLAETAKTSRRNDLIIVYFSGHGAQVPQPKPVPKGRWIEPDGLDEVFLTRDTKLWDKRNQRVEGALLDDEIGNALAEFTRKGVDIWSIFDTCHAGDMARSRPPTMGSAIWRGVDAGDLGVPIEAIQLSAKVTVGKYRVLGPKQRPTVNVKSMPINRARLIAFYAAQSNESAPEEIFQFPETGIFPKSLGTHGRFGVFTWELARAMSATPPTFAALAESITQQYQTRPFPTPAFEGTLAKQIFH